MFKHELYTQIGLAAIKMQQVAIEFQLQSSLLATVMVQYWPLTNLFTFGSYHMKSKPKP